MPTPAALILGAEHHPKKKTKQKLPPAPPQRPTQNARPGMRLPSLRLCAGLGLLSLALAHAFIVPSRHPRLQRSSSEFVTLAQTPPNSPATRDFELEPRATALEREVRELRRDVAVLRKVVQGMSGALIFCDDMALRERELLINLSVYADLNLTSTRPPALLRRTLLGVLNEHQLSPTPLMQNWRSPQND
tara:strand:+ start:331 stop:900 length:570 start_codon:yes stop_codon:yes gene_type:complete